MRDGAVRVGMRVREVEVGGEEIESILGGVRYLLILLVGREAFSFWDFLFMKCSFPYFFSTLGVASLIASMSCSP